jgi:Carboxypeptidase regulatory-like domain
MRMLWTGVKGASCALSFVTGVLAPSAAAVAQGTGIVLSITVRDARTGDPVPAAEVTVRDANLQARTDWTGHALIPDVPATAGSIRVRRLGYASLDKELNAIGRDTVRMMLQLTPVAQNLPRTAVVDTAALSPLPEFESRRGNRFGWFITEKEIRTRMGSRLSDLVLTKIPGLRIKDLPDGSWIPYSTRGPRNLYGGLCMPLIFFDGVQVSGGAFDLAPLSLLAGVEYYSPGFIPVQYKALAAAPSPNPSVGTPSAECGALLLWTVR